MGSFLSKPITEKESIEEFSDRLNYGASSMQGWRDSQEDAHNCILEYDKNTSLFAVYDGHGGQEVAQYCSERLPEFIKNTEAYKQGNIEKALIDGFLGFDATLKSCEVIEYLKKLKSQMKKNRFDDDDDDDDDGMDKSDEEENYNNLYEEAAMPIEQVIEKYTKAKKESDSTVGTSTASSSETTTESSSNDTCNDGVSSSSSDTIEPNSSIDENNAEASVGKSSNNIKSEENGPQQSIPEIKISLPDSSDTKEAAAVISTEIKNDDKITPPQNGEVSTRDSEAQAKSDVSSSSPPTENGELSKKGKGKAILKPETVKSPRLKRPRRSAQQLYQKWLDFGEDSEEESDEEDKTFEDPNVEVSSEEDADGVNIAIDVENSEEDSSDDNEGEEDDDNDDDDDDDLDEDEENLNFVRNMKEGPGFNSGCTAVVALLKGNELFVANAGDSRCIVCRNGKAVEMSFDHKPEDEPERQRVIKAGGRVSIDGRVNGGLNLSRAIGDHDYKQNKELSDKEQMITALPDVKTLIVNPKEDEFMVLACDGIWNYMSSQEVVDFVRPKMQENKKLSEICEEMFDHCLAPDTLGDGTGCDNMTAIIIKFKSNILKRASSTEPDESVSKVAKTEDNSESHVDTTV